MRRIDRCRHWKLAVAWLALLGPLFYVSYGLANAWASSLQHVGTAAFEWELGIPFLAWTIFPYWTINAFYALSLFLARTRHELHRHGLRLLTAQIIAVCSFLIWPLHFSFGQPEVHDGPSAWLFSALRSFDKPFNQAPSLHVALAVILWDWYRRQLPPGWAHAVLHMWTLAICASVLTTFQHHFIDIPTGAMLGLVCIWLWPLERRVALPTAWQFTRDRTRLTLGTLYGIAALSILWMGLRIGGVALWLAWPAASLAIVALCYVGLGQRGFSMDPRGRMALPARWLLGPYRLCAALNAWLWTRRVPAKAQVQPGIWLGRIPKVAEWNAAGRPLVISLCAELQLPRGVQGRCVPMMDLATPSSTQLQRAVMTIEAARITGRPIWICCALGFSRSAGTLAAWLCRFGGADNPRQSLALLKNARPQVVVNDSWQRLLHQYHASLSTNRHESDLRTEPE